ncbi:MAG: phosphohydrolase [Anaerolineae bacterium]|nr:phosphohydrolase [Anaerolineae bacterium]
MSLFRGCPGAVNIREVKPEEIECPECGHMVEIWSDELTARCSNCGASVSREQGPSCIDWCSFAEECIGTDKYRQLKNSGTATEQAS